MKRLLLIDATAYLFRAYHAVRDLRTRSGKPTGAVFGTLTMLAKLSRREPTAQLVCVMDAAGKNFRHALYPDYKATRPPAPPELIEQIAVLQQFIHARGLPLVSLPGVEADDILATYARQGVAAGREVLIASSDKDLMQLVSDDSITLYDGMKDTLYDAAAVKAKYGVPPPLMGDYLALTGDSSDNIPGVRKVGAKTAVKWLTEYGSLAAVRAAAADIVGAVGNNLRAAIADGTLALSRQLVTLKEDVAVPPLPPPQQAPVADNERWQQLCIEYEFSSLHKSVEETPIAPPRPAVELITDTAALTRWCEKIRAAGRVAVDTETVGEPEMQASLVGIALSVTGADAAYIPLAHTAVTDNEAQLPAAEVLAALRPLLEDPAIGKIMHNGKYDWHIFANVGVRLAGVLDDTKIIAYVHRATEDNTLGKLAVNYLATDTIPYKQVVDGKTVPDFAAVPLAAAAEYAGEDAWVTRRLYDTLQPRLSPAAAAVYTEIDRPLLPILAAIERNGMKIDAAELKHFAAEMQQRLTELEAEAHRSAGRSFNLNSPQQLAQILFDEMGAAPLKKTGRGARSTDERTLEKLAADFPLARLLLEHRTLAKLIGTYVDKLPRLLLPATGRVHTRFNQTAVLTGRLSSSSPNLQNIPIKTDAGRRIRRAFIAEDGCCLVSADYSQIELRLMAHIAGDRALLDAFAAGADIHRRTAAEVFGAALAEVTGEQRRAAKAINFGLIYGMSAFGLARALAVSKQQAQVYIDRYFSRYPQVAAFMQRIRKEGTKQGYVETLYGRRIPLDTIRGGAAAVERVAINAPIQGSAADVMKKAMLAVDDYLRREKLPAKMILQVHDELVLEVEQAAADDLCAALPRLLALPGFSLPLEVAVGRGMNWGDAH